MFTRGSNRVFDLRLFPLLAGLIPNLFWDRKRVLAEVQALWQKKKKMEEEAEGAPISMLTVDFEPLIYVVPPCAPTMTLCEVLESVIAAEGSADSKAERAYNFYWGLHRYASTQPPLQIFKQARFSAPL